MKIDRREPVNIYRRRQEDEPGKRVRLAAIIKYIFLTIVGILLFRAGQAQALAERGYEALGGEVFALFLPVFYWMVSRIVRDTLNTGSEKRPWRKTKRSAPCSTAAGWRKCCHVYHE